MQVQQCDGCRFKEPVDTPKDKKSILPVTFAVINDPRETFAEAADHYKADLCDNCRGTVLHNYFRIRAEGKLDVPAFIEPVDAERELLQVIG